MDIRTHTVVWVLFRSIVWETEFVLAYSITGQVHIVYLQIEVHVSVNHTI